MAAHSIDVQIVQVCDDAGQVCAPLGPGDFDLARPNAYAYEDQVNEIWEQADIRVDFDYVRWNNSAALDLTAGERRRLFALGGDWDVGTPPPAPIDGVQFFFLRRHEGFVPSPGSNQAQVSGLTEIGIMQPVFSTNGRGIMGNEGTAFFSFSGVLAHELGHALGLRHIGNAAGGNLNDPQVSLSDSTPNLMWAGGQGPGFDSDQTLIQNFPLTPAQIQAVIANGTSPDFDPDGNGEGPLKPIEVEQPVADTIPPTIVVPDGLTVEGDTTGGANRSNRMIAGFLQGASASDNVDTSVTVTNDGPSLFPVGETTVNFSATDAAGNNAMATAVVTVADTTAPVLEVPGDLSVTATGDQGVEATSSRVATFLSAASAADIVDDSVTITTDAPSILPIGENTITFTATDDAGNTTTATAVVTVREASLTSLALDVTGNGNVNAFQDGILIVRFMLGQPDANLEDERLIPSDAVRTTGTEIRAHLESAGDALDVNGDGNVNAFQDGILMLRFLLGQPAANLQDARLIPEGSTRQTGEAIAAHLSDLLPGVVESESLGNSSDRPAEGELTSMIRTMINPVDINGDGRVSALDALKIVNQLSQDAHNEGFPWLRHDVNGDGRVSAVDALRVINRIGNAHAIEVLPPSKPQRVARLDAFQVSLVDRAFAEVAGVAGVADDDSDFDEWEW